MLGVQCTAITDAFIPSFVVVGVVVGRESVGTW